MTAPGTKARLENGLLQIWYGNKQPAPWTTLGLNALELVYKGLRQATRQNTKAARCKHPTKPPVLVVGNLIAGGAGKTPIVMAVCKAMRSKGKRVGIISRGYGRNQTEAMLIRPGQPTPEASKVGDEPLFLSLQTGCPVAVCADRSTALRQLLQAFPDIDLVVSDDGLQHHRLIRQIEWVVFDSRGQGNGRLLPAGPLREPLNRLDTVDAVLASNVTVPELGQLLKRPAAPHWHEVKVTLSGFRQLHTGKFLSASQARQDWDGLEIAAFTGIANPDKLFSALQQVGLSLSVKQGLPDHFKYPDDFCTQFNQPVLITSGKDAVKLNSSNPKVWVADIEVELSPALILALEDCIGSTID